MNNKIDMYIQHRLNIKKNYFQIDFDNIHSELLQEWILKYDGITTRGEKLEIVRNGKSWSFECIWLLWLMVNDGMVKNYYVDKIPCRIQNFAGRNVGNKDTKVRFYGDFTCQTANGDWVPMAK